LRGDAQMIGDHLYIGIPDCDVAFLLPAKVASSSIKRVIRAAMNAPPPPDLLEYLTASEAITREHRIAFVREPLDRLASCWADKFVLRRRAGREILPDLSAMGMSYDTSFSDFVRRVAQIPDEEAWGDAKHFRSQSFDLTCRGQWMPTFLGRFESLAESWNQARTLIRDLGGPRLPKLGHLRKTDRGGVEWTSDLERLARQRYARDIEQLGYSC